MEKNLTEISNELNRISRFKGKPRLIFMTDNEAQPHPEETIDRMPEGSMVILRDYDDENRHDLAKALSYICQSKGIKFLVAGDLTLALMVDADGVHLPKYMAQDAESIKIDNPNFIITIAANSKKAVEKAELLGVYAVLVAPVFPTKSHPETFEDQSLLIGTEQLQELCSEFDIAIYALGGVNVETAERIKHSGIAGFAAIRGI
jgi:thiamine-phosphate pyrophosphorylase